MEMRFEPLERLDALEEMWSDCTSCDLYKHRTKVVQWRGASSARLFAIGEGPGEDEDRRGIPFYGPAGRELDILLIEAGLSPYEDVFITNLVACRPPNNRVPTADEVRGCRPRLEAMLRIVNPKVLLLLGGTAALRLAGITAITRWRGHAVNVELAMYQGDIWERQAVPTFHPSYLLRSGNSSKIRRQIVSDIKLAWELARG